MKPIFGFVNVVITFRRRSRASLHYAGSPLAAVLAQPDSLRQSRNYGFLFYLVLSNDISGSST